MDTHSAGISLCCPDICNLGCFSKLNSGMTSSFAPGQVVQPEFVCILSSHTPEQIGHTQAETVPETKLIPELCLNIVWKIYWLIWAKKARKNILRVMEQMIELQFCGSALTLSVVNQRFHWYSFSILNSWPTEHTVTQLLIPIPAV